MSAIPLRIIAEPLDGPDKSWQVPGNMWRDDECWVVVLPNGDLWYSGIPASDGSYWTVTGEAPNITVTPSIDDRDPENPWHGWIRNGELVNV